MERVAAKKAKTRPRVSQRECQLALQRVQFLGSEALRPAPQGHNAKPNTQPRPGPMGRLAFLLGIPDRAPRATRVGRAAGLGIRPTTKKKGRGRGCAWSEPNAGVRARLSGLEYLFVRRPRRRRAEGGEGQRKPRSLPQMPCVRPDRRSPLPRGERPPLALLQGPDHVVRRWLEGPCLHSEGEERLGDVGGGHRQTFDMSGGQTHRFLFRTPGSSR